MDNPLNDIRIGQISHEWANTQKIKSFYFPHVDSTNTKAKSEAFNEDTLSENLTLYFTEVQTAGRGRGQNSWSNSHPGSQLLSTWSFMIQENVQPILSPLVGLALYKAACTTWPFLDFNLKAPNDLFINDKKVAGLLIEMVTQGDDTRLLIGIGLNVLTSPKEIENSTSLVSELPKTAPLLAQDWIAFLERFIFEISMSIQLAYEPLDSTACASLHYALNLHPLLNEKYTSVDSFGSLVTKSKKINWADL